MHFFVLYVSKLNSDDTRLSVTLQASDRANSTCITCEKHADLLVVFLKKFLVRKSTLFNKARVLTSALASLFC